MAHVGELHAPSRDRSASSTGSHAKGNFPLIHATALPKAGPIAKHIKRNRDDAHAELAVAPAA